MHRFGQLGAALTVVGILVALNAGMFPGRPFEYAGIILGLGVADAGILMLLLSEYNR